jgi:hypothetical protein
MSARLLLMLLVLAAPLAGHTDEQAANLTDVAEALREGKIDVGEVYSIDAKKGRYHAVHVDVLGLDCGSCHYGDTYRADYLLVGKTKPYAKRSEGRYDRTGCLGCHRTGGEGTAFYGNNATPK